MADVLVPAGGLTGLIRLDQPNQVLRAAPGVSVGVLRGAVYIPASGVGARIDRSVKIVFDNPQAGAVQCAAPRARVNCEIDLNGKPGHGVQIVKTVVQPDNVNLDGLYVYNNTQRPGDTTVGFNHGVYFQNGVRATGVGLRFTDIRGGRALHFYPEHRDAIIAQVSTQRCFGDVVFWAGAAGNRVIRLFSQQVGAKGIVEVGGGSSQTVSDVDFVTSAETGYGWQPVGVDPSGSVAVLEGVIADLNAVVRKVGGVIGALDG